MYPLYSSDFNQPWNRLYRFSNTSQISNFMKICPVGSQLFNVKGQTDMTTLSVAFCNFIITPRTMNHKVMHKHISLMLQSKVYFSFHWFSWDMQLISGTVWRSSTPSFTQTCWEIREVWPEIQWSRICLLQISLLWNSWFLNYVL
jgi:hypothetical protein